MSPVRHDWTLDEMVELVDRPFHDLLSEAQRTHREHFDPNVIEGAMLLSIKTGGCPEDCAYCPQAARYHTGVEADPLMAVDAIVTAATAVGATRFCMGAAWRSPNDRQVAHVATAVTAIKALELETCATLGMLTGDQAKCLAEAGLDYYNHNLDTDPTSIARSSPLERVYQDRLDTLAAVRDANIKVCCGGIVGMGETRRVRAGLLR